MQNTLNIRSLLSGMFLAVVSMLASCRTDPYLPEVRIVTTNLQGESGTLYRFSDEQFQHMENTPFDPLLFVAYLEQRWSLDKIHAYCKPEKRCPVGLQNLTSHRIFGTNIHQSASHDFGEIFVYVCEDNGKVMAYGSDFRRNWRRWTYSLNITRTNGHWKDYWRIIEDLPNDWMNNRDALEATRPTTSAIPPQVHRPAPPAVSNAPIDVSSPEQLSSLLEKRWSVDNIKRFCIPETRFPPSGYSFSDLWNQLYWAESANEIWEGHLHQGREKEIGAVWWFATVKNGLLDAVSVNVIQGRDHWNLETLTKPSALSVELEPREVVQRRVLISVKKSLDLYRWGGVSVEKNEVEDMLWQSHRILFDDEWLADETWSFSSQGEIPSRYTRYVDYGERRVVAVRLDGNAKPVGFFVEDRESEYLEKVYASFTANYSKWLGRFVYGDPPQLLSGDMTWSAHLEALGLDPMETNCLTGVDGRHPVIPAGSSNVAAIGDLIHQPDYRAWQSITNGMTEAEVLQILDRPEVREGRKVGDSWHYGIVVPKSQVFPAPCEFAIWFRSGHVQGKKDPFDGRFSTNGLPTTPRLIQPIDGAVFSNYPYVADLRWSPSSGEYPMSYEVHFDFAKGETNTTVPHVSVSISCGNPVRWRVRAVNRLGTSPWSEERVFRKE